MRIAQGITEILNVCMEGSGIPPSEFSYILSLLIEHDTKLVGVVFEPSAGGTPLGPYIGSILAFTKTAQDLVEDGLIDYVFDLLHEKFGEENLAARVKESILRRGEGRMFVVIIERSRLNSEYAKQEMAKLNSEFFTYLRENRYLIFTICRKTTSYKTYKRMASNQTFRFFLDVEIPYGYMDSIEPFHVVYGEFLP